MRVYSEKTLRNNVQYGSSGRVDHSGGVAQRTSLEGGHNSSHRNHLQAFQGMADQSQQTKQAIQLQAMADNYIARQNHLSHKNAISSVSGKPIQLFQTVDLEGELDEDSYQKRASSEEKGANAFGADNLARAVIILANGNEVTLFAYSSRESAHSEEKLIDEIKNTYGAEVLTRDPKTPDETRIKEIYTERAPCESDNADLGRKKRQETEGNCNSLLSKKIHDAIPVIHSVKNNPYKHTELMNKGKLRFADEIVNGKRQMTYQNAINRNGYSYFKNIRMLCFKKNGDYGRNYFSEVNKTREYISQFSSTIKSFGMDIAYRKMLIDAFESVPHYKGGGESETVLSNLDKAAEIIKEKIDIELSYEFTPTVMEEKSEKTIKKPGRYKPGLSTSLEIRPFPKKTDQIKLIDPLKKEKMEKDLSLARRIRGNRDENL